MIERILQLRSQSVPISDIARQCGLTVGQVKYQLRKHKRVLVSSGGPSATRQAEESPHEETRQGGSPPAEWKLAPFYGENVIKLMVQSPTVLYVYWEITWPRMRMVASYLQTDYRNIEKGIRLYDVTDRYFDGSNAHGHQDIIVTGDTSSWYITGVAPGRTYIADFGLFHQNRFCPILRSLPVATPRNVPAPWGDPLVPPAPDPGTPAWFENFSSYSIYLK